MEEDEPVFDLFEEEPPAPLHARDWSAVDVGGASVLVEAKQNAVWDSALLVSQWLAERPAMVQTLRVGELGSGLALPSLTAALCGAASVVATDYDPHSVAAAARAAEHNHAVTGCPALGRFRAECLNWRDAAAPDYEPAWIVDTLIAADCNYYSQASPWLVAAALAHLAEGGTLLLASRDGRNGLELCLELLRSSGQLSEEPRHSFTPSDHLWVFRRRPGGGLRGEDGLRERAETGSG